LAHDLGHPPFGHIAEEELHQLLSDAGEENGFEGNPQSFRIVTRLETRAADRGGLDLTRATLNALLKYPMLRPRIGKQHLKFGAYEAEKDELDFARKHVFAKNRRSLEADIMDWADDITYAVHDLEDFYRTGKIPLDALAKSPALVERFFDARFEIRKDASGDEPQPQPHKTAGYKKVVSAEQFQSYKTAAMQFFKICPVSEPYTGRRTQRAALRGLASSLIHEAVTGVSLSETGLLRPEESQRTVAVLKQLTWNFVIEDPALASEQYGKRTVIRRLFEVLGNAATDPKAWKMFPVALQEQLQDRSVSTARTTADYIASMGEQRAVELYAELAGSALKPMMTGVPL
jgi:dGTPase